MVGKMPLNKLLCYITVFCCVVIYILLDLTVNLGWVDVRNTGALSSKYYWHTYHTTTDVLKIAATIGWFLHVGYGRIITKLFSAMIAAWFTITSIVLFVSDHAYGFGFKDDRGPLIDDGSLVYIWLFIGTVIGLAGYRAIRGVTSLKTIPVDTGNLYLVIGKPSGFFQLSIPLILTGKGAWFGITDGESIWEYDKKANGLVKVPYREGYALGRGVELICAKDPLKLHYLESRVGDVYSTFNSDKNCIGLLEIAKRWQDEVRQGGRNEG